MKPIIATLLAAAIMSVSAQSAKAGNTYRYKDIAVTVKNPDPAKGRVYLSPYHQDDTSHCSISNLLTQAKIDGNLSTTNNKFDIYIIPDAAPGYILDCLSFPDAYASRNYRSNALYTNDGTPLAGIRITADNDTTGCPTTRPKRTASERVKPQSEGLLYAIFKPATAASVTNRVAGSVASVVKKSRYGEDVNELTVSGPINRADMQYLNDLSIKKNLRRLDLSKAKFSVIPDSAFFLSDLNELKLPADIQAVGKHAFAYAVGLRPLQLRPGVIKGEEYIMGCRFMELLGIKEAAVPKDDDDDSFFNLW